MSDEDCPAGGVGPYGLPPALEAVRRRGLWRGVLLTAAVVAVAMAIALAWFVRGLATQFGGA